MELYDISEIFADDHGMSISKLGARNNRLSIEYQFSGTEILKIARFLPFRMDGNPDEVRVEAYNIPGMEADLHISFAVGSLKDYLAQLENAKKDGYWNDLCEDVLEKFSSYLDVLHHAEKYPGVLLDESFDSFDIKGLVTLLRVIYPPTAVKYINS